MPVTGSLYSARYHLGEARRLAANLEPAAVSPEDLAECLRHTRAALSALISHAALVDDALHR